MAGKTNLKHGHVAKIDGPVRVKVSEPITAADVKAVPVGGTNACLVPAQDATRGKMLAHCRAASFVPAPGLVVSGTALALARATPRAEQAAVRDGPRDALAVPRIGAAERINVADAAAAERFLTPRGIPVLATASREPEAVSVWFAGVGEIVQRQHTYSAAEPDLPI